MNYREKAPVSRSFILSLAEQQRFELWLGVSPLTVFKTVPLNRLGTAPCWAILTDFEEFKTRVDDPGLNLFMVGAIGLEPMTFRTSSGCSPS